MTSDEQSPKGVKRWEPTHGSRLIDVTYLVRSTPLEHEYTYVASSDHDRQIAASFAAIAELKIELSIGHELNSNQAKTIAKQARVIEKLKEQRNEWILATQTTKTRYHELVGINDAELERVRKERG